MHKYSKKFMGIFISMLLLAVPVTVLAQDDAELQLAPGETELADEEEVYNQEKDFCERNGGTWETTEVCSDTKEGEEQECEQVEVCTCPEGKELMTCGVCLEDLDWGESPSDKETCELGNGTWQDESDIVEEVAAEAPADAVDENEAPTGGDDEDTVTDGTTDDMLGSCECPTNHYWSLEGKCEEIPMQYICESTCGTWDETSESCTCWDDEAVWDEADGCTVAMDPKDETTVGTESDKDDTDSKKDNKEDDPKVYEMDAMTLYSVIGGSFLGGLILGAVFVHLLEKNQSPDGKIKTEKNEEPKSESPVVDKLKEE